MRGLVPVLIIGVIIALFWVSYLVGKYREYQEGKIKRKKAKHRNDLIDLQKQYHQALAELVEQIKVEYNGRVVSYSGYMINAINPEVRERYREKLRKLDIEINIKKDALELHYATRLEKLMRRHREELHDLGEYL